VSPYDLPGLVAGIAGTWLFLVGMAIAVPSAIRIALSLRQPGKGRLARGLVVGGGIVALAGIVLFWGAQSPEQARTFDRAAPFVGVSAVVVAALVAWRVTRRGPPAAREEHPPPPSA
jgi:hypothetical protein